MQSKFVCAADGERLDVFLTKASELTRSHVKKLIDGGFVGVCGKAAKPNLVLRAGDCVEMNVPEPEKSAVKPVDIPLDVVYEDGDIAVINKQQGLTVHAGNGTGDYTLVNALLYRLDSLSGINGVIRPGIVHRIDKETSGLLAVAKNDRAHLSLAKQIADKTCARSYLALVHGNVKNDGGRIDTFISRSQKDRTAYCVCDRGRRAVTDYRVIKRYEGYTLCEFCLLTGRTHQIRVHCKYLGNPVVGDRVYGPKKCPFGLEGQLLHAYRLALSHPTSGKRMTFTAPLPDYFKEVLAKLKPLDDKNLPISALSEVSSVNAE